MAVSLKIRPENLAMGAVQSKTAYLFFIYPSQNKL